mgnify:CR=1 FL=1
MDKNQNINDISGIQLFTLMNLLNDFEKTIKKIRDTGFKNIELFGPYPFRDRKSTRLNSSHQ